MSQSDIALSVRGVSKSYTIGAEQEKHATLVETLLARARSPFRRTPKNEFMALNDVSFDVKKGEVVGIIGRNGAGKSTLLKILSRITEPTSGRVDLYGRVGSLLEVGTGFHPELTGRENVFLNGAILGMSKGEIRKQFDAIVDFAGVSQFLDTPVKRYSSGMYVRLAFAVAAHLESEILIVDEVLAVGDAEFQKKCLGKMKDVAGYGKTVLFVSHNVPAVTQLTQKCILLQNGHLVFSGKTEHTIEKYVNDDLNHSRTEFEVEHLKREHLGTQGARIIRLYYEKELPRFKSNEAFTFVIAIRANIDLFRLRTSITIFSNDGTPVGGSFGSDNHRMNAGEEVEYRMSLNDHHLAPGHYYCDVGIGKGEPRTGHIDYDVVPRTLQFEILPDEGDSSSLSVWLSCWGRIIYPPMRCESAA